MTVFQNAEQFEAVLSGLFDRITHTPTIAEPLADTGMVIRFRYTEPEAVVTFDFASKPPHMTLSAEGEAHVEMTQSADTAHQFWLGRLSAVKAIATGKVQAKGDVSKAMKLLPAIKPAFALYPEVLHDLGLDHTIPKETNGDDRTKVGAWLHKLGARKLFKQLEARLHFVGAVDPERLLRDNRPPERSAASSPAEPRPGAAIPEDAVALRIAMWRRMCLIRELEEHLARQWDSGAIPTSAIHLSSGQEATAVGVCFALRRDDLIATTHRGHGHMVAKGAPVDRMIAEIYGKKTGLCEGMGGSMHVTDAAIGAIGANGIVGSSPLLAMGAGLSADVLGEDRVAVAFLGDGATNQGMFHEAVNLASAWQLPVLFVIENNHYGEFTKQSLSTGVERLADRAAAYGIEGRTIDGNDVEEVHRVASELVATIRGGQGPVILECVTYRYRGHMEGDRQLYRSAEEVEAWKKKDPIARLGRRLIEDDQATESELSDWGAEVRAEVEAAHRFALDSGDPSPEALTRHVFSPSPSSSPTAVMDGSSEIITASAAINLALSEELERDPRVIVLGEDVSYGGYLAVTTGLVETFGRDRIRDTPISENAIVGGAVGAAMTGLRPVAEILFADFLTACADPLVNQAAKLRYMSGGQYRVPLVVRTPCGVGLGMAAQHSQSFESLLMGIPGLIIAAPGTPRACRALLKSAIRSDNPVIFFEHKLLYLCEEAVPVEEELMPLGKAAVVREGQDVTLVGALYAVQVALEAAEELERRGVSAEVIDLRCLAPLDGDTVLASVAKTRRLVTLEEGPIRHGWGAEVVARIASAAHGVLVAPPLRLGGTDNPIPYNKTLENLSVPDAEGVTEAVAAIC